jgi:hypothetical protein
VLDGKAVGFDVLTQPSAYKKQHESSMLKSKSLVLVLGY